jgi:hypothetical protein
MAACCDLHGTNCEPLDLCCGLCTEAEHPKHPPGVMCVTPFLGGSYFEQELEQLLKDTP